MKETIPSTLIKKPDATQLDLSFDFVPKDFHGEMEEAYLNDHEKNIVDNKKIEPEKSDEGEDDLDFDDPELFEKLEAFKEDDPDYYYNTLEKITKYNEEKFFNRYPKNFSEENDFLNINRIDSPIMTETENPGEENWGRFEQFKNKMKRYSGIFKNKKTEVEKNLAKKIAIKKAMDKINFNKIKDMSINSQDPAL